MPEGRLEGDARVFLAVKKLAVKSRKREAEVTVECTNVTVHGDGSFFGWLLLYCRLIMAAVSFHN